MVYMKLIFAFIALFSVLNAYANFTYDCGSTLKIAIIDTGLDLNDPRFSGHICRSGHMSFLDNSVIDKHGHGTHVAGLIQEYAGPGNYCFLIYKFYDMTNSGRQNLLNEITAIGEAAKNGAKIVNISGGGEMFSEEEYLALKGNPQILFILAAGNDGRNLDIKGNEYYPASYNISNTIVVGNKDSKGNIAPTSNRGQAVDVYEVGVNVLSLFPGGRKAIMTGTSQATAIHTGKIVRQLLNKCDRVKY